MSVAKDMLMIATVTFLLETPVMIVGLIRQIRAIGIGRIVLNSLLINFVTNLSLNTILAVIGSLFGYRMTIRLCAVAVLEIAVYFSESALYKKAFCPEASRRKVSLTVLAANVFSFAIGICIFGI